MPAPAKNLAPSVSLAPNVTTIPTPGGHGKGRSAKDIATARLLLGQYEARQPPAAFVQPETEYDEP